MNKQISYIAPVQAALVLGALYLMLLLLSLLGGLAYGYWHGLLSLLLERPIQMWLLGFIGLYCALGFLAFWLFACAYNLIATVTGGIRVTVTECPD